MLSKIVDKRTRDLIMDAYYTTKELRENRKDKNKEEEVKVRALPPKLD